MYNIKSFYPKFGYLDEIWEWIKQLSLGSDLLSQNNLVLIINEAFTNSLRATRAEKTQVVLILKEEINPKKLLDIIVSDSGDGFLLNGKSWPFPEDFLGEDFLIAEQNGLSVFATLTAKDQLSFFFKHNSIDKELSESGRGLISIIKLSSQVRYFYSAGSFNYISIKVEE